MKLIVNFPTIAGLKTPKHVTPKITVLTGEKGMEKIRYFFHKVDGVIAYFPDKWSEREYLGVFKMMCELSKLQTRVPVALFFLEEYNWKSPIDNFVDTSAEATPTGVGPVAMRIKYSHEIDLFSKKVLTYPFCNQESFDRLVLNSLKQQSLSPFLVPQVIDEEYESKSKEWYNPEDSDWPGKPDKKTFVRNLKNLQEICK